MYLTREARQHLRIGTEVPIRVEPGTQIVTGIDAEAFEAEVASGAVDRGAVSKAPGAPVVDTSDLSATPPVADPADVIAGVDFDTWVAVEAHLATRPVPPTQHDEVATSLGVAPGAWATAQSGWQERMRADWKLAACFGEAFQAATGR